MAKGMILRRGGGPKRLPAFTYTGSYQLFEDGDKNWRIKFLESGTLTFAATTTIDAFYVGGGGSPNRHTTNNPVAGCGGFTETHKGIVLVAGTPYSIVIGAGAIVPAGTTSNGLTGGATSAFTFKVLGGQGGAYTTERYGGSGGAGQGGDGGVDGGDGTGYYYGRGQGTTTREFGEASGQLYASGGNSRSSAQVKAPNTGDGGDCRTTTNTVGTPGASGIVVIRNHRA